MNLTITVHGDKTEDGDEVHVVQVESEDAVVSTMVGTKLDALKHITGVMAGLLLRAAEE